MSCSPRVQITYLPRIEDYAVERQKKKCCAEFVWSGQAKYKHTDVIGLLVETADFVIFMWKVTFRLFYYFFWTNGVCANDGPHPYSFWVDLVSVGRSVGPSVVGRYELRFSCYKITVKRLSFFRRTVWGKCRTFFLWFSGVCGWILQLILFRNNSVIEKVLKM